MSSEEDHIRRIKKELIKTGFPTEIIVDRTLSSRKWQVYSQVPFIDKFENQLRTLDFQAYFNLPYSEYPTVPKAS